MFLSCLLHTLYDCITPNFIFLYNSKLWHITLYDFMTLASNFAYSSGWHKSLQIVHAHLWKVSFWDLRVQRREFKSYLRRIKWSPLGMNCDGFLHWSLRVCYDADCGRACVWTESDSEIWAGHLLFTNHTAPQAQALHPLKSLLSQIWGLQWQCLCYHCALAPPSSAWSLQ